MTYVNPSFVNSSNYIKNKFSTIKLANGAEDTIPLAIVIIKLTDVDVPLTVGVMNTPIDVLLGPDFELFFNNKHTAFLSINGSPLEVNVNRVNYPIECIMDYSLAVTRSMALENKTNKAQLDKQLHIQQPKINKLSSNNSISTESLNSISSLNSSDIDSSETELDNNNKLIDNVDKISSVFDVSIDSLISLQKSDASINHFFRQYRCL